MADVKISSIPEGNKVEDHGDLIYDQDMLDGTSFFGSVGTSSTRRYEFKSLKDSVISHMLGGFECFVTQEICKTKRWTTAIIDELKAEISDMAGVTSLIIENVNGTDRATWTTIDPDGNTETHTYNFVSTGGGIPDAPNDGKLYGRQNESWSEITGLVGVDFIRNSNPIIQGNVDISNELGEIITIPMNDPHNIGDLYLDPSKRIGVIINSDLTNITIRTISLPQSNSMLFVSDFSTANPVINNSYVIEKMDGMKIGDLVVINNGLSIVDRPPCVGIITKIDNVGVTVTIISIQNSGGVITPPSWFQINDIGTGNIRVYNPGDTMTVDINQLIITQGTPKIGDYVWKGFGGGYVEWQMCVPFIGLVTNVSASTVTLKILSRSDNPVLPVTSAVVDQCYSLGRGVSSQWFICTSYEDPLIFPSGNSGTIRGIRTCENSGDDNYYNFQTIWTIPDEQNSEPAMFMRYSLSNNNDGNNWTPWKRVDNNYPSNDGKIYGIKDQQWSEIVTSPDSKTLAIRYTNTLTDFSASLNDFMNNFSTNSSLEYLNVSVDGANLWTTNIPVNGFGSNLVQIRIEKNNDNFSQYIITVISNSGRVFSVGSDGVSINTWSEAYDKSLVNDVQVNGTSVVDQNKIANIDLSNYMTADEVNAAIQNAFVARMPEITETVIQNLPFTITSANHLI